MELQRQHQELVDLAARIVQRQQEGRADIAAELIVRALLGGDADTTFALALALAEQALKSVETSRVEASAAGYRWVPAMHDTATAALITAEDHAVAPIPLAMRMLEALHRGLGGDQQALGELGEIYQIASTAPEAVFAEMFAALATFAVHGRTDTVRTTAEPVAG